jgi:hypothetical protein
MSLYPMIDPAYPDGESAENIDRRSLREYNEVFHGKLDTL